MSRRFSDTGPAQFIVDEIKIGVYKNTTTIIGLLKQIINDLPGTDVAKEAQQLLYKYI